ncbi:hypothetical protein DOTSEDRAFT_53061 [Dothistroma septosporum NZE10]|uniref:Uncharacterized protein n=1 Tax=Dothistroma septosporum (strain NZE10 / CBS 128990) TaxID=675120 RepID=N1PMV7_DOTSN|nr:hypothetical protein DOTSEDRAFT_53061 [Dothistroma septosporum NZE10]
MADRPRYRTLDRRWRRLECSLHAVNSAIFECQKDLEDLEQQARRLRAELVAVQREILNDHQGYAEIMRMAHITSEPPYLPEQAHPKVTRDVRQHSLSRSSREISRRSSTSDPSQSTVTATHESDDSLTDPTDEEVIRAPEGPHGRQMLIRVAGRSSGDYVNDHVATTGKEDKQEEAKERLALVSQHSTTKEIYARSTRRALRYDASYHVDSEEDDEDEDEEGPISARQEKEKHRQKRPRIASLHSDSEKGTVARSTPIVLRHDPSYRAKNDELHNNEEDTFSVSQRKERRSQRSTGRKNSYHSPAQTAKA